MQYHCTTERLLSTFTLTTWRPRILLGHRLNCCRERAARSAPLGPEIHQHWPLRLQHNLLEIAVVHFLNKFSHQSSPRMISSMMAFIMNSSAASSTPCRCISAKSFLPSLSMKVTAFNTTFIGRSRMTIRCQQPSNS